MKKQSRANVLLWLILAFIIPFAVQAQIVTPKTRTETPATGLFVREYKLDSKLMARQMPYNLIMPESYDSADNKSKKYAVIYLLHGLSGHYDNWADKTKLYEYAAKYQYILVMPEGDNGWYTDSISEKNDRYESYIIEELIPEIDRKFNTTADRNHRFIAGLSMGGYGSIKFGLKYPQMFALVGSFSGALGAADWTEKELGTKGAIPESILKTFGAAGSQTRKENDIFQMLRDISAEKIKNLPFIYLDCGTEDFLIQNNHDFVKLLNEKKIPHEFRELPGNHNWTFWDAQVQEFLRLSERFIKK
ncbi:MAG: alpha/beta hydrolase family protein [Pyrinomonadaceae bacterium]